ncbi:MAG: hypothetical protein WD691_05535 [Acidimicrobiales bacterium]
MQRPSGVDRESVADDVDGGEVLTVWGIRQGTAVDDLGLRVEEPQGELHAADPIGEGVVQLHHDGGLTVGEALDDGHLPERVRRVEGRHHVAAGLLHHLVPRWQ